MTAIQRDGTEINIGDEVETTWNNCEGYIFIVSEILEDTACESGFLIQAYLKGYPDRPLKTRGIGLDVNWFRKIIQ